MSAEAGNETLAAILDGLTLVQEQLEEIDARTKQVEAQQIDILTRLGNIHHKQIEPGGVVSQFDHILTDLREGREATGAGFERVAELVGWAHAAAVGNPAALPVDVVDNPLLERFVLSQPADRTSRVRALMDWKRAAKGLDTDRLADVLRQQYRPSPTDSPRDRMLRYQLAAISRDELEGRGASLPDRPSSTYPTDRSVAAQRARSAELLAVWRAGDRAELYAEPELAGALDILEAARCEGATLPENDLSTGLADLRQTIADRLEAGDRPTLATRPRHIPLAANIDRHR